MAPEFLCGKKIIVLFFNRLFVWSSEIAISYRQALEDTFVLQFNLNNCLFSS